MKPMTEGCFFFGLPISVLLMLCMAAGLTAADLPMQSFHILAVLPVICGCFAAGYMSGRRGRRRGLFCGLLSAAMLCGIWFAAACLLTCRLHIPLWITAALPCGCCGGILGVNTRLPLPLPHSHRAAGMQQRLAVSAASRHRPRKPQESSAQIKLKCLLF
ncbi:MAG: TIGR04086 family membrane protein [Oscillospiraceae bacterium]|nr:TIGR04086 family membrane protein [Oscillospiraceae bacterium]